MKKMTSAFANKMLRQLAEDKEYWENVENESRVYVAAVDEEPVVPEYDFVEISANLKDIDEKIVKIKHALNVTNATNQVDVGGVPMTVDEILIRMAQANKRKQTLDWMRKQLPKTRETNRYSISANGPEYRYINYDLGLVKAEFERISEEIMAMQIALDKYNQTVEFEVEI